MEKIAVDEIMEQIRQEIKDKNYTEADLSFADVEGYDLGVVNYNPKVLETNLERANESFMVAWFFPLPGNPVAVFIKKVIRKLTKFFVAPIVEQQNNFNNAAVQTMGQLAAFTRENESLKRQVAELQKQVEALQAAQQKADEGK